MIQFTLIYIGVALFSAADPLERDNKPPDILHQHHQQEDNGSEIAIRQTQSPAHGNTYISLPYIEFYFMNLKLKGLK